MSSSPFNNPPGGSNPYQAGPPPSNEPEWHMQAPTGQSYGPVTFVELQSWVAQGRINAQCQLLKAGWNGWRSAAEVFPQLVGGPSLGGQNFAGGMGTYAAPHRGSMVLAMGILSIVFCPITGPIAWVMGNQDLEQMKAGTMDPSGEQVTQAGKICGIIGSVILLLQLLLMVFYIVMIIFVGFAAVANSSNGM